MNKKIGKYANDKKDFVRPKEDLRGKTIRQDEPLHRTRNIGGGYFVVMPLMDRDNPGLDEIIDGLRKELKIAVKPVKVVKEL